MIPSLFFDNQLVAAHETGILIFYKIRKDKKIKEISINMLNVAFCTYTFLRKNETINTYVKFLRKFR